MDEIVVFSLDEHYYGIYLDCVERVVPSVAITPVPKASELIRGVFNLEGELIPILNFPALLGLADHPIQLNDLMIIIRLDQKKLAVVVNSVNDLLEDDSHEICTNPGSLTGVQYFEKVLQYQEHSILVLGHLDQLFAEALSMQVGG